MLKDKVSQAVEQDGGMTVTVLDHKTTDAAGPAQLSKSYRVYRHLKNFEEKVRAIITCAAPHEVFVFVNQKGKRMKSKKVTEQLNSLFTRSVGKTKYCHCVGGALVRRSVATEGRSKHPEHKEDLTLLMNHQLKTQDSHYFLQEKIKVAGRMSARLRNILRGADDDSNQAIQIYR